MTPKEKAEELVSKYYLKVETLEKQKHCALIAVSEIIENLNKISKDLLSCDYQPNNHLYYWMDVNREILKL